MEYKDFKDTDHDVKKTMGIDDDDVYFDENELIQVLYKSMDMFIEEHNLRESYDSWFEKNVDRIHIDKE